MLINVPLRQLLTSRLQVSVSQKPKKYPSKLVDPTNAGRSNDQIFSVWTIKEVTERLIRYTNGSGGKREFHGLRERKKENESHVKKSFRREGWCRGSKKDELMKGRREEEEEGDRGGSVSGTRREEEGLARVAPSSLPRTLL